MLLWRISRHRDLTGAGGLRAPGRWHDRGSPIIYLAETPAGALLETCVHTSANDVPPNYTLLAVRVEEQTVETLELNALRSDWIDHLEPMKCSSPRQSVRARGQARSSISARRPFATL
jgi:RES domain-containing protein